MRLSGSARAGGGTGDALNIAANEADNGAVVRVDDKCVVVEGPPVVVRVIVQAMEGWVGWFHVGWAANEIDNVNPSHRCLPAIS